MSELSGKFLRNKSIQKNKLNLVSPVESTDPVTKQYSIEKNIIYSTLNAVRLANKSEFSDKLQIGDSLYKYDSTDTTSVDNGNTIIKTLDGKVYKKIYTDLNPDVVEQLPVSEPQKAFIETKLTYDTIVGFRSRFDTTLDSIHITDLDKSGLFKLDPSDTTSADDGVLVLVKDNKRYKRQVDTELSVSLFGIKPDYDPITQTGNNWYNTFNTAIKAKGHKNIRIPKGNYHFALFPSMDNAHIIGEPGTVIYLKTVGGSTPVMAQFSGTNTTYENIRFESLEPDLPQQRAEITGSNLRFVNCGFINFKNPTGIVNSWGNYIKGKNITLDNCYYSGNSQSDIAILEGAENITIINARNDIDGGVHLNIEPNVAAINTVTVIGGKFRKVELLENSYVATSSENITIIGAKITLLTYDGSSTKFINCQISDIQQQSVTFNYAGELGLNIDTGKNLIADPYLVDVMHLGTLTYWTTLVASTFQVDRVSNGEGVFTRINNTNTNQILTIQNRNYISISGTKKLLFYCNSRANIQSNSGQIAQHVLIRYYDASDVELRIESIIINRGAQGVNTPFKNQFAISTPPVGAVKIKLNIGNTASSNISTDWKAIGLVEINSLIGGTDVNGLIDEIVIPKRYKLSVLPTNSSHPSFFTGEEITLNTITKGLYTKYICTQTGKPATFAPTNLVDGLRIGTTGQRDSAPVNGSIHSDTTLNTLIQFNSTTGLWNPSSKWKNSSVGFSGGTFAPTIENEIILLNLNTALTYNFNVSTLVPAGTIKWFKNINNGLATIVLLGGVTVDGVTTNIPLKKNEELVIILTANNTWITLSKKLIGVNVPNTATTPSASYTQAEMTSILTELRALKTSLVNAGVIL